MFLLKPDQKSLRSKMKKPHLCISQEHYSSLLEKLHAADMIVYSEKPPIAVNRPFGVLKSHIAHRLIIDAQNTNTLFLESPKVDLPNPEGSDESVSRTGRDHMDV